MTSVPKRKEVIVLINANDDHIYVVWLTSGHSFDGPPWMVTASSIHEAVETVNTMLVAQRYVTPRPFVFAAKKLDAKFGIRGVLAFEPVRKFWVEASDPEAVHESR